MLDDWDQRLVVTTLQVDEEGHRLELQQVAEKDQVSGASLKIFLFDEVDDYHRHRCVNYESKRF